MNSAREQLDRLFVVDAIASMIFGIVSLLAPHGVLQHLGGGFYNHNVHEILRLYGCLRIAFGYIIWYIRHVDDGKFRKCVCEALFLCYGIQALVVLRAQLTDKENSDNNNNNNNDQQQHNDQHYLWNWMAIIILLTLAIAYGSFRFRHGGNLIKVYELPTSSALH